MDKRIADLIIILLSFRESFLLGLFVTTYVMYATVDKRKVKEEYVEKIRQIKEEYVKIENKWKEKYENAQEEIEAWRKQQEMEDKLKEEFKAPEMTPYKFIHYRDYIIEDYGGFYVVIDKDMNRYPKMFHSIEETQRHIDLHS